MKKNKNPKRSHFSSLTLQVINPIATSVAPWPILWVYIPVFNFLQGTGSTPSYCLSLEIVAWDHHQLDLIRIAFPEMDGHCQFAPKTRENLLRSQVQVTTPRREIQEGPLILSMFKPKEKIHKDPISKSLEPGFVVWNLPLSQQFSSGKWEKPMATPGPSHAPGLLRIWECGDAYYKLNSPLDGISSCCQNVSSPFFPNNSKHARGVFKERPWKPPKFKRSYHHQGLVCKSETKNARPPRQVRRRAYSAASLVQCTRPFDHNSSSTHRCHCTGRLEGVGLGW